MMSASNVTMIGAMQAEATSVGPGHEEVKQNLFSESFMQGMAGAGEKNPLFGAEVHQQKGWLGGKETINADVKSTAIIQPGFTRDLGKEIKDSGTKAFTYSADSTALGAVSVVRAEENVPPSVESPVGSSQKLFGTPMQQAPEEPIDDAAGLLGAKDIVRGRIFSPDEVDAPAQEQKTTEKSGDAGVTKKARKNQGAHPASTEPSQKVSVGTQGTGRDLGIPLDTGQTSVPSTGSVASSSEAGKEFFASSSTTAPVQSLLVGRADSNHAAGNPTSSTIGNGTDNTATAGPEHEQVFSENETKTGDAEKGGAAAVQASSENGDRVQDTLAGSASPSGHLPGGNMAAAVLTFPSPLHEQPGGSVAKALPEVPGMPGGRSQGTEELHGYGESGVLVSSPRLLEATPTALEIGIQSGTHGWLKVRAEMADGGTVNASVSAASAASQSMLHRELPALTAYLEQEKVAVATVVVHTEAQPGASSQGYAVTADAGQTQQSSSGTGDQRRQHQSTDSPQRGHVSYSKQVEPEDELPVISSSISGWRLSIRA